ncbi:LexA family transcriptional regulator [Aureimonas glaciei]|uniref:HTH cro/C1-type domain-containing protein n=1 Tax=Aureimonas glaciei TaxID=1776957 RepID=A0A916Y5T1_9HYPH|nr:XRE family transcriptional regulator [Aureimonas glaciei]GGD31066.1 hypothetical protein GCM10011335_37650 [Aureimonas glaciei]
MVEPKVRLRELREKAGLSGPAEAARRFKFNENTYTSHENGNRPISKKAAQKYAEAYGATAGWILFGNDNQSPRPADILPQVPIPASELVGPTDFPVYAAAQGGNGHLIVSFDAIDWVKRPAPLARVKGGYGLLIDGESMTPAFRPGDTALVHPHLPPERGTDVILYHTPPDGEAEAIIKHLIGFSDREWTLEQYRPPEEFKEFRQEWPICHRVVGKYSRR